MIIYKTFLENILQALLDHIEQMTYYQLTLVLGFGSLQIRWPPKNHCWVVLKAHYATTLRFFACAAYETKLLYQNK